MIKVKMLLSKKSCSTWLEHDPHRHHQWDICHIHPLESNPSHNQKQDPLKCIQYTRNSPDENENITNCTILFFLPSPSLFNINKHEMISSFIPIGFKSGAKKLTRFLFEKKNTKFYLLSYCYLHVCSDLKYLFHFWSHRYPLINVFELQYKIHTLNSLPVCTHKFK